MKNKVGYYQDDRKEVSALLPKRYSKVLEIGCAEGNFRKNLEQDHEYWGVEPIQSVAEVASKKLDKVLVGIYQEVCKQIPDNYFDLVVCNDVIEHMVDHDAFLKSIKKKMKKDGYLVASIPNVRYISNVYRLLIEKDWEYKGAGLLDRTHLRFFTEKSLRRTINEHDFEIDAWQGMKPYSPKSVLDTLFSSFVLLLLGHDAKFLLFGVRLKMS